MMLTSETLLVRWNALNEKAAGFTRIDPVHPLELYIGYEGVGQRSLLLISDAEPNHVDSSKSVTVHIRQRQDERWAVTFRLVRKEQEEVYLQLCCDLIEASRHHSGQHHGVEFLLNRYRLWHKLMERQADGLLSEAGRKGLVGELQFLLRLLNAGMTPVDAVTGWIGPEKGDRDFVFADGWHEIKSVGASTKTVTISSLEQLDAAGPGELVVYLIDRTAPGDSAGFSLNDKVTEVRARLRASAAALDLFETKLTVDFQYLPLREYETPVYRQSGIRRYTVDHRFPRLTKESLPAQVAGATYELSLAALEEWRTE